MNPGPVHCAVRVLKCESAEIGVEMRSLWEMERRGWRDVLDEAAASREGTGQPCPSGLAGTQVFRSIYGYLGVFTGI